MCYNCNEKFTKNFFGNSGRSQEGHPTEADQEEVMGTLEISLYTLVISPRNMQVIDIIYCRRLYILIDSGNTHNFVNSKLGKKLNCCKVPTIAFQPAVVGLQCEEICQAVPIEI